MLVYQSVMKWIEMVVWKKALNHLSSAVFYQQFQGTFFSLQGDPHVYGL